ncbi:MAG: FkbM family methyltransferase [Verrucomicrobiota bacterium]
MIGAESLKTSTATRFIGLLKPGQTIIDIGANVGYYSLTAAMQVGPTGQVIAFEPNPKAAARLQENKSLNGISNLTIVRAAVADKSGSLFLHLGEDTEASSIYDLKSEATLSSVEVSVVTLDEYVETHALSIVDLLKIDAEGAEVSILHGARKFLKQPSAPSIIIEANPLTLEAACESVTTLRTTLESFGYAIAVIDAEIWQGVTVENWLATKTPQQEHQSL